MSTTRSKLLLVALSATSAQALRTTFLRLNSDLERQLAGLDLEVQDVADDRRRVYCITQLLELHSARRPALRCNRWPG